jgi:class 3 adenylate cyclase
MEQRAPDFAERLLKGASPSPLELLVGEARYAAEIARNAVQWASLVVIIGAVGLFVVRNDAPGMHPVGVVFAVLTSLLLIAAMGLIGPRGARLFFPWIAVWGSATAGMTIWAAGPSLEASAVLIPGYTAATWLFFTRRNATITTILTSVAYGAVLLLSDGYPMPVGRWLFVSGVTLATALMIGQFVSQLERLASSERSLHARVEAANDKLRRFLPTQVADAVLAPSSDDALATHRRQIAVAFIDLRGFTAFSAVAEPEDVVEVLTGFFGAVGTVAQAADATVGSFAGDGVMAYFNDPVPCDDPVDRAYDMALALREPMKHFGEKWRGRGFAIGHGVGIAYGYATIGTIGFDARIDYTPIGSVVNLASRLCDEAAPDELLLDGRAFEALRGRVDAQATQLQLKGFSNAVTAYRVSL